MLLNGFNDRGSLTQLLMRRLNMTGNAPVPVLMPELGSNLVLESDRPEWGWAKEEMRFGFAAVIAAVAAERPILWIPPIGNRMLAVIEEITISASANFLGNVIGRPTQPALTGAPAISNPSHIDDRFNANAPWAWVNGTNPAIPAATRVYAAARGLANTAVSIRTPIICTDREGVCVYITGTNLQAEYAVKGYYRRAQPGELV